MNKVSERDENVNGYVGVKDEQVNELEDERTEWVNG